MDQEEAPNLVNCECYLQKVNKNVYIISSPYTAWSCFASGVGLGGFSKRDIDIKIIGGR